MESITKLKDLLKKSLFFLFCGTILIFNLGFKLPAPISEKLSTLPYIGKYFKPTLPPQKLKDKAQEALEEAFLAGAKDYAPQTLNQAQKLYQKGLTYLAEEKFSWAQESFKKAIELAHKAQKKALQRKEELKEEYRQKYIQIANKVKNYNDLALNLRLRYLKALLDQERFEEFEAEYIRFKRDLQHMKGGLRPPLDTKKELR